jgi:hypothetical protein
MDKCMAVHAPLVNSAQRRLAVEFAKITPKQSSEACFSKTLLSTRALEAMGRKTWAAAWYAGSSLQNCSMSDGGVVERELGKLELSLDEDEDEKVAGMFVASGVINDRTNDMANESIIYIYLTHTASESGGGSTSNKNRAPG